MELGFGQYAGGQLDNSDEDGDDPGDARAVSGDAEVVPEIRDPAGSTVEPVNGMGVRIIHAMQGKYGRHTAARWLVACNNPGHIGCTKSRSVVLDNAFGPNGARYFFQAWHCNIPKKIAEAHRKWAPSAADIREYLRLHPQ